MVDENEDNNMEVDKENPDTQNTSSVQAHNTDLKLDSNHQSISLSESEQKLKTKSEDKTSPQNQKSALEEAKSGAKSTPEKNNEEEDESEEEYSGEG